MQRLRQHLDRELILLLVLSAFALAPLASPGYFFNAHDADHSVFYFVEFDKAIRDGILWPRWSPDHAMGYGYPFWIVYAPLGYYVAEVFHLLGLGLTAALKAAWGIGFIWGGAGMYLLLRRWFGYTPTGRAAALVGGLLYVYAPYHLVTIYVRAAFAEFFALAWFPWVLLAFDRVLETPTTSPWRRIAAAALLYAALLLTHTGTILIFTPFLLVYLLFGLIKQARQAGWQTRITRAAALRVAVAGLLAVGLAAIFLFPLLTEQRYVAAESWVQGTYGYRDHFVYPSQWLDASWGYGYSVSGPNDGMSFQLGLLGVVLAAATLITALHRSRPARSVLLFCLLIGAALLWAMTPAARPVWDAFGPAAMIQFPWRLLGLAGLCLAALAAGAINSLLPANAPAEQATPPAALLGVATVLASLWFTVPQYTPITPVDESVQSIIRFETAYPEMIGHMAATQQDFSESPLTAQYRAGLPLEKAVLLSGSGSVHTTRLRSAQVTAAVNTDGAATVLFYTYDFPGWYATLDGRRVPHRTEPPYGLIAVDVPGGQHELTIRFGTTPVRNAGMVVSALSIAIIAWMITRKK
ncbi:MAG: DUF6541 family protein [Caldilineales bacterium]